MGQLTLHFEHGETMLSVRERYVCLCQIVRRPHAREGQSLHPTVLPHPWQFIEDVKHSQVRSTWSCETSSGQNVVELDGDESVLKRIMCGLRRSTACNACARREVND